MTLLCDLNTERRKRLRASTGNLNGIDYAVTNGNRVELHLFKLLSGQFDPRELLVRDKRRWVPLQIDDVQRSDYSITFTVDRPKLRMPYQVEFIAVDADGDRRATPPSWIDPRNSAAELTFYDQPRVADVAIQRSPVTEVDPLPMLRPVEPTRADPDVSLLARDYASFRQLLLDRFAQIMPDWREHHASDLGVALIELLAYVGDRLTYQQDAVATEAYLETARQRISVRRHARLVDYRMHEGCNARAYVHLRTSQDTSFAPENIAFITAPPSQFQIKETVLLEADLPDQLYAHVVYFEAIKEVPRGPDFTAADVIDPRRLAPMQQNSWLSEKVNNLLPPDVAKVWRSRKTNVAHALSESELKHVVRALNRLIRDEDLRSYATGSSQQVLSACRISSVAEKPQQLRWQNRAVLESHFSGALARANPTGRIMLYTAHNRIPFYTWDETDCWLAKGATAATLVDDVVVDATGAGCQSADTSHDDRILQLNPGDVLVFEEVKGPRTGNSADADPNRRQAVRLTRVTRSEDPLHPDKKIVEIEWHPDDALQFSLCLSSQIAAPDCRPVADVSVARGNILLVDHGRTIRDEPLGTVAGGWRQINCGSEWEEPAWIQERERFRPLLSQADLTHVRPTAPEGPGRLAHRDPRDASPAIRLLGVPGIPATGETLPLRPGDFNPDTLHQRYLAWKHSTDQKHLAFFVEDLLDTEIAFSLADPAASAAVKQAAADQLLAESSWQVQFDLMSSIAQERHFALETDNDRRAHLRFGDNDQGRVPDVGTQFWATYRIGNGVAGNVGGESIVHLVSRTGAGSMIETVRNPLPAVGGVDPESIAEVKLYAPHAFRTEQLRAILEQDYADHVMRKFGDRVQSARANIHWAGTFWHVDVYLDPLSSVRRFADLAEEISAHLKPLRRIWHRVAVSRGTLVPLDLKMTACVKPGRVRSEVRSELMDLFSNRDLGGGKHGLFHSDNLTFGQSIYVSHLIKAAKQLDGVENVVVTHLSRHGSDANVAIPLTGRPEQQSDAPNYLEIAPGEIAQLDNTGSDQGGTFCLTLEGGR